MEWRIWLIIVGVFGFGIGLPLVGAGIAVLLVPFLWLGELLGLNDGSWRKNE